MKRTAVYNRETNETKIMAELALDGSVGYEINTGIGFLDHMLESFTKHGKFGLKLQAQGDLAVDQHHLAEDIGIVLGETFNQALGTKAGINRTGFFVYPMDEALAVAAVDISGRPYLQYDAVFKRRFCGGFDTDLMEDFLQAFAVHFKANVVVRMPYGRNDHHKLEAIFKALGKAVRMACSLDPRDLEGIPSTKGVIDDDRHN